MKKIVMMLMISAILFSCASVRESASKKNEDKHWVEQLMRKPQEKVVINQKDANPDDYNFVVTKVNDSIVSLRCYFDDKKVSRLILWDKDEKLAVFANGSHYRLKAKKEEYLLRCSTFEAGKKTQRFTHYVKVNAGAISVTPVKKSPSLDKFIAGDMRDFSDTKPTVVFRRQGLSQKMAMKISDSGDNAGLKSYSVDGKKKFDLEGIKSYKKTFAGENLFSLEVEDIGGNKTSKKYKPFNSPYSFSGSFQPFGEVAFASASFKIKNDFYNDSYRNVSPALALSYGLEWNKYVGDLDLQARLSAAKSENAGHYSFNTIGGELSVIGLWTSSGEYHKDGLRLGLGLYFEDASFGFFKTLENLSQPLFLDSLHSVFYSGQAVLKDSVAYREAVIPIILGWEKELSKHLLVGASIEPSLSWQKGAWLSYGKNSGLEGKYFADQKIIIFSGNELENASVKEIGGFNFGLNDFKIKAFAQINLSDFTLRTSLCYRLDRVDGVSTWLKQRTFLASASLSYRLWW